MYQMVLDKGGVLSPVCSLFYLDGLLQKLADSGVGCHWGKLCHHVSSHWCFKGS